MNAPTETGRPATTRNRFHAWGELALVVSAFGILTVLLIAPMALHLGSVGRLDNADTRMLIWNVAWVARTLIVDPLHVLDANIFYPHRGTLVYSESNLGAGVLAIPVYWATRNPYAAHNFVVLLTFVLSGTATYYLVRYLSGDRRAAAISGICFAYCPYVFSHLPHIHLLMTAGVPLSMLAFHRLADRPTAWRGAALGLALGGQAPFCGYYTVFAGLTVAFAVLVALAIRRRWTDLRYWASIAVAAAVATAIALLMFVPYVRLQQAEDFRRPFEDARLFSATWRTYFASSAYAHAWMLPIIRHWNEVLFPGFIAVIGGVAGLVVGWVSRQHRELSILYGSLAALAFWASLGPDAGLYTVLTATNPAFTFIRAPSRIGVVVAFALSVLAGLSISALLARLEGRTPAGGEIQSAPRSRRRPAVVAALLAAAAVAELKVPLTFSPTTPTEPAYRALAALPRGPVIEIPFYSTRFAAERTRYMLASTAHWMPLVNGFSSHIPRDVLENTPTLGSFPSREAFKILKRDQVRYAVFHMHTLDPAARASVVARLGEYDRNLLRRYADNRIWLYEIVGFPD
jgi:hypothetical protein